MHVFFGERANDVEEAFCFDGHPARGGDARRAGTENGDVEIRGRDLEPAVRGLEQDIRKDRNRRTLLDHSLAQLQFLLKVRFSYAQLHGFSSFKPRMYFL